MASDYDFDAIEAKWQRRWADAGIFRRDAREGKRFYCLTMFPYPSGALHMGHVINYTLGDAVVRFHAMRGENVLSPMGWDAFGLPAENYAIKNGVHPEDSTCSCIAKMREQMHRAGWAYDWSAEVTTCDPSYYRWTQWIFLQLYRNGLAFKKMAPVNWCPCCQTVLANEQVHQGACERCGTEVEQRDMEQWFFKMSAYAQRLLDGHRALEGKWPASVIRMQEEWIGRSEGARLDFRIVAPGSPADGKPLPVYTTRPDTTYGVTFLAIAPEHPVVADLVRGTPREAEVMAAVRRMRNQPKIERTAEEAEKEGVPTGRHVANPFDGSRVEIWVTNYALMDYGTGAVMAVPAHDQRDFLFARKYRLPVKVVIRPPDRDLDAASIGAAYVEPGIMVNSAPFDGMPSGDAIRAMTAHARDRGLGDFQTHYRLKDWLLSRQRYWGAPIPIVYCDTCGMVPVPESDLPVLLPRNVEFKPTGESPLARCADFVRTACPRCQGPARRETDTMDTFVDSSWYFLRYASPKAEAAAFDRADVARWLPVDRYIGGHEHATMHLIYARFVTMALKDLGHLAFEEPFTSLFCQGMVCATAYYCSACKWVARAEVDGDALLCKKCGGAVKAQVHKMSKTKKNGVSPDDLIRKYGADTVRLAILFFGPADQDVEYDERGVEGVSRFVRRLFQTFGERVAAVRGARPLAPADAAALGEPWRSLRRKAHQVLAKVTESFDRSAFQTFNTCIAAFMELANQLRDTPVPAVGEAAAAACCREAIEILVRSLAPFAPHVAEEMWEATGHGESVFLAGWPEADLRALEVAETEVVLQVNGKVRGRARVPTGLGEREAREMVLAHQQVAPHIAGKNVKKFIWVADKLANVVVG